MLKAGVSRKIVVDKIAHVIISGLALSAVISVFLILIYVAKEALLVFGGKDGLRLSDLFGSPFTYQPISSEPKYNLVPLLTGTVKISAIAIVIAFPISLFAAIYSSEFTGKIMRNIIKPMVELLAALPSIVIGFFALIYLATVFQGAFGLQFRLNSLTAGTAVAILLIPTLFTLIEEALYLVPLSIREAGYSLGASKTRLIFRLVVPIALPGIVAAFILSFGRALGETIVVMMAAGNAAILSASIFEPARTLASNVGSEMAEVVFGSTHYHVLFFCGFLLLIITMTLNFLSHFLISRLAAKTQR